MYCPQNFQKIDIIKIQVIRDEIIHLIFIFNNKQVHLAKTGSLKLDIR